MKLLLILFSVMTNNSDTVLVGKKEISQVKSNASCAWLNAGIDAYKSDEALVNELKKTDLKEFKVVVICGSWCEDTQHLLPQFVKVAHQISLNNIDYYFVDREKKSPENAREKFNVDRIPTFIIYKNDKEIGRIIETVSEPIETVLTKIIKQ
ncbi:MAG: thioredoxin family protein [Bacteroidota bacterium]